jgi:hypothetical protein
VYWQFATNSAPYLDTTPTLTGSLDKYLYAFKDAPALWTLLFVLAAFTSIVIARRGQMELALSVAAIGLGSIAASVVMRFEPRVLLPLEACGIVGGFLCLDLGFRRAQWSQQRLPQHVALVASVLLCAVVVFVGVDRFRSALSWYGSVTQDDLSGLEWLHTNTPTNSLIATSPTRQGFQLSWWVEGLAQRRSYATTPFRYLSLTEERKQATVAREIYLKDRAEDAALVAALYGVEYLVIDRKAALESWPGWISGPADGDALKEVFSNTAVRVLRPSDERFTARRLAIAEVYRRLLGRVPDYQVLVSYDQAGLDLTTIAESVFCSNESVHNNPERVQSCDRIQASKLSG